MLASRPILTDVAKGPVLGFLVWGRYLNNTQVRHIKQMAAMQGSVGLDLARQHSPDLILLDLNLPDIPGTEVLSRLQQKPGTAGIPVIVISADATGRRITRLLAAGARAYLTKPLDVAEFLNVLEETLSHP